METNSVNSNAKHQKENLSEKDVVMEVDENDNEEISLKSLDGGFTQKLHGLAQKFVEDNRKNRGNLSD